MIAHALLLACFLGTVSIALAIDIGAVVGWVQRRWR
jgi:hypothetical protein